MVNLCKFEIFLFFIKINNENVLLYLGNSGIIIEVHDESEPNGNLFCVRVPVFFFFFFDIKFPLINN